MRQSIKQRDISSPSSHRCHICGSVLYTFKQDGKDQYECHNGHNYKGGEIGGYELTGPACPMYMVTMPLTQLEDLPAEDIASRQSQANMFARLHGSRSYIKQYMTVSHPMSPSEVSHLECPYCDQRTIHISSQGQTVVNPDFMAAHRAGQSTDGIEKFIKFPILTCQNPKCVLFGYTKSQPEFLKLYNKSKNDIYQEFHNPNSSYRALPKVKNNGSPPLFKLDFPSVASKDKCPSCGSTLYKFDDKSLKQESENSFRECKNKSCRLYGVILPLGRMSDISDLEIHNFRNRQDRQDELAKGKSPFEAYDATSNKTIPDGDKLDKLRDYRYSRVKTVVKRQFKKPGY
jgi:DNA-directed RNA polymerase subunit M/transcription elongation factor TFIIS